MVPSQVIHHVTCVKTSAPFAPCWKRCATPVAYSSLAIQPRNSEGLPQRWHHVEPRSRFGWFLFVCFYHTTKGLFCLNAQRPSSEPQTRRNWTRWRISVARRRFQWPLAVMQAPRALRYRKRVASKSVDRTPLATNTVKYYSQHISKNFSNAQKMFLHGVNEIQQYGFCACATLCACVDNFLHDPPPHSIYIGRDIDPLFKHNKKQFTSNNLMK